jgi:hypothetical protein
LLAIAQRNGHAWQSGSLVYLDQPIRETHRGRVEGLTRSKPLGRLGLTQEGIEAAIAGMKER